MSSSVEASELLRQLAEPAAAGAHIETLIRSVARRVGLSFSRAKALWYREARRIDSDEMDALRAAARKQEATNRDVHEEIQELRDRLTRLQQRLEDKGTPMDS